MTNSTTLLRCCAVAAAKLPIATQALAAFQNIAPLEERSLFFELALQKMLTHVKSPERSLVGRSVSVKLSRKVK